MRRLIGFSSKGHALLGTLDDAPGNVGVLIVSGGQEPRAGAHRGMAALATALSSRGIPVFRFDRTGIGDSAGSDQGYASSKFDIFNASLVFTNEIESLVGIVGFGNCDAASALALFGRECGVDRVVLANPWVIESTDDLPQVAAIRQRYVGRLLDPKAWVRLMTGGIDLRRAIRGLRKAASTDRGILADQVLAGIKYWGSAAHVVLAAEDATAIAYHDAAMVAGVNVPTTTIDTASHSFARPGDSAKLEQVIVAAVAALQREMSSN